MLYQSCQLLVVKLLLLVGALAGVQAAFAQAAKANDYRLNPTRGCFIKAIKNRTYVDVDMEKFSQVKIHALAHPSRPKYFAFKSAGVIHLTPKKCLIAWESDDLDGLNDIEETEEFDKYERHNKAASERRVINRIELGEMNYFIELGGGANFFANGKGRLDKKSMDAFERELETIPGITSARFLDSKSKLDNSSPTAFQIKFGHKSSSTSFWIYGFRAYSFKRREDYRILTNDVAEGTLSFDVYDDVREFSLGHRFIINSKSDVRPFFDVSLLLSVTEQTIDINDVVSRFSGSGLGAALEAGLEFLFSRNLALKVAAGYNYYFINRFRVKESDGSETNRGYDSQFKYSNFSATAGLVFYFR